MRDFNNLIIWQKSHALALQIYTVTASFPQHEVFALISQMRRCAISIPSNIAEGCGRNSITELKRFLTISCGSCSELEYQLLLSHNLQYISENIYKELVQLVIYIRRMILSFIKRLQTSSTYHP